MGPRWTRHSLGQKVKGQGHQTYTNDVLCGTEMNALHFGVKRSQIKVTVE